MVRPLIDQGHVDEALAMAQAAVEALHAAEAGSFVAMGYFNLSAAYQANDKLAEALAAVDEALQLGPTPVQRMAMLLRAELLIKLERSDEALQIYRSIPPAAMRQLDPGIRIDIAWNAATAYAAQAKNEQAERSRVHAFDVAQEEVRALASRGMAAVREAATAEPEERLLVYEGALAAFNRASGRINHMRLILGDLDRARESTGARTDSRHCRNAIRARAIRPRDP